MRLTTTRQQGDLSAAQRLQREQPPLTVPVLFVAFNRPLQTLKVFEAIRRVQPPRLYVAVDGPRQGIPDDAMKCERVRRIVTGIDWPCEVKTLLRSDNLGCKKAVSSAITWFFENEPEGIILEDDCLPSPSFFWFCQELLARFRDDERIWQVCGNAMVEPSSYKRTQESYIFSRYGSIWGWATWRRAWAHYDGDLTDWMSMIRPPLLNSVFKARSERRLLLKLGNALRTGQLDTWDYQWEFTKAYQSGLSIVPSVNMIMNIGFGPDATHTLRPQRFAPSSNSEISFPLVHPRYLVANDRHDLLCRDQILFEVKGGWVKRAVRGLLNCGLRLCVDTLMRQRSPSIGSASRLKSVLP